MLTIWILATKDAEIARKDAEIAALEAKVERLEKILFGLALDCMYFLQYCTISLIL